MDNRDIDDRFSEELVAEHTNKHGKTIYRAPPSGTGLVDDGYLYRSMPLEEAKNWLKPGWVPSTSGHPWSTNPVYSESYMNKDSDVQLEVSAKALLISFKAMGASPKYESGRTGVECETWSTGPKSEVGRHDSKPANTSIKNMYNKMKEDSGQDNVSDSSKKHKKLPKPPSLKDMQNQMFVIQFKQRLLTDVRVIARLR